MAGLRGGRRNAKNSRNDAGTSGNVDSLISTLVAEKVKAALANVATTPSDTPRLPKATTRNKRLFSERGESDVEESPGTPTPGATNDAAPPPPKKQTMDGSSSTKYTSQVVILQGVKDDVKNHPVRLSQAFAAAKPDIKIKGLRLTASNSVLVTPQDPKDCCALLKQNAFPRDCPLGEKVTAHLPKSQSITHQVVIKRVDKEVTMEEIEEILERQELSFKGVRRIQSRARGEPTEMVRLFLTNEEDKKRLLKQGIYLDQMHFKCEQAKEDMSNFPKVLQCYKCQKVGDHISAKCENDTKCVLCSGQHRKSECTASKAEYKCANCGENHPSWSPDCKYIVEARKGKERPTMAQVASATVTPTHLTATVDSIVDAIMESIALVVSEVVSRCLCELSLDIIGNKLNKKDLPSKVEKVAINATNATNASRKTLGSTGTQVRAEHVKQTTLEKCFANHFTPASTSNERSASSQPQHGL